jgi:hypothetical protein
MSSFMLLKFCFGRDRYQLTGRLLLLSVSGNSLRLSELQLTCGLETAHHQTALTPESTRQLTLQSRLPAPVALLPAAVDPGRLAGGAALLDRIRNWVLGKAIAIATDHETEESESDRFDLLAEDVLPAASPLPACDLKERANIFLDSMEQAAGWLPPTSCAHHTAWSLLQPAEAGTSGEQNRLAAVTFVGDCERYTVLSRPGQAADDKPCCSCLVLLPARQRGQAEDLQKELGQADAAAVQLDSCQVGSLVLYRDKVKFRIYSK